MNLLDDGSDELEAHAAAAAATVLNLPHCHGMLDEDEHEQHSVHAWLLKAAAAAVQSASTSFQPSGGAFMRASISFCRRLPQP